MGDKIATALVFIELNVSLPKTFIETFNRQESSRHAAGGLDSILCVDPKRSCNHIVVVVIWRSHHEAIEYWNSPERKAEIDAWNNARGLQPKIKII